MPERHEGEQRHERRQRDRDSVGRCDECAAGADLSSPGRALRTVESETHTVELVRVFDRRVEHKGTNVIG